MIVRFFGRLMVGLAFAIILNCIFYLLGIGQAQRAQDPQWDGTRGRVVVELWP